MNVIEALVLIALFCLVFILPLYVSAWTGIPYAWIVVPAIGALATIVTVLIRSARLPSCRSGRCRDRDYELIELGDDGSMLYECGCGERFLARKDRFLWVDQDGVERPFMMKRRLGWDTDR